MVLSLIVAGSPIGYHKIFHSRERTEDVERLAVEVILAYLKELALAGH
jgi:hypothetical protein